MKTGLKKNDLKSSYIVWDPTIVIIINIKTIINRDLSLDFKH